ncbi:MAG: hypothetical protein NT154_14725, partial [Verrucomicrobia bacterium]|nr:hypothetical protein [Verrucomicrobiota bacterium]
TIPSQALAASMITLTDLRNGPLSWQRSRSHTVQTWFYHNNWNLHFTGRYYITFASRFTL